MNYSVILLMSISKNHRFKLDMVLQELRLHLCPTNHLLSFAIAPQNQNYSFARTDWAQSGDSV